MEIGFIGLGKMGFPMARRLIEAGHQLTVFDTRKEAVDRLVAMGAQAPSADDAPHRRGNHEAGTIDRTSSSFETPLRGSSG